MDYSKLKILFCVAVCLAILLAPFALDMTPDGKAYAGIFGSNGNRKPEGLKKFGGKKPKTSWSHYKPLKSEGQGEAQTTHQVPEPATLLLVGGGLVSLATFRRKFKK